MKKTSLNFTKIFILFFTIFLIQGCTKFADEQDLKRKNLYDSKKDIKNTYTISLHSVEIVHEDGIQNGLIEVGETVWYRISIINNGPDPAPISSFEIIKNSSLFIQDNSSSASNFTYSIVGTYISKPYLEPGEIYVLSNGEVTTNDEIYTYNLRRPWQTVGTDPSMDIIVGGSGGYVFNIPIDYQ